MPRGNYYKTSNLLMISSPHKKNETNETNETKMQEDNGESTYKKQFVD